MKIFSKFKDYYDHIQQFGQGDDVSYIRNTETYCDPYSTFVYNKFNKKIRSVTEYGEKFNKYNDAVANADAHYLAKIMHGVDDNATT